MYLWVHFSEGNVSAVEKQYESDDRDQVWRFDYRTYYTVFLKDVAQIAYIARTWYSQSDLRDLLQRVPMMSRLYS